MILGAMDQKLWDFKVFRRSLGKVGICCSQPARVDHMHKKRRAEGKKKFTKKRTGLDQASTHGRPAIASRWPGLAR
jgi:hypothetical protein